MFKCFLKSVSSCPHLKSLQEVIVIVKSYHYIEEAKRGNKKLKTCTSNAYNTWIQIVALNLNGFVTVCRPPMGGNNASPIHVEMLGLCDVGI